MDSSVAQIAALPAEVAAQIKSSTSIVSLNEAILGLLCNSLDAGASKVEVSLDYKRGNCVVEDNGLGIAPAEFKQGGGLGRPYRMTPFGLW